jgi:PAS domain-containing protein
MWIFDPPTGLLVVANDAALYAYGYTRTDLLTRRVQDLCQPHGNEWLMTTLRVKGSLWAGTVTQRRKDGAAFDADMAMIETGSAAHPAIMVIANPIPMAKRQSPESGKREAWEDGARPPSPWLIDQIFAIRE